MFRMLMITLFATLASFANAKDFYEDKELKMIIAATVSPAGGFDMNTRMIGMYLPKYIPGNPSIVYRNVPHSGGLSAANMVFEESKQDGTTILFPIHNVLTRGITRDSNEIKYSSSKFNWIGATDDYSIDRIIVYKRKDVQLEIDYSNILFGDTAAAKAFEIGPLLKNTLGTNVKLIYGYKSKAELELALERGEINAYHNSYSVLKPTNYSNVDRIAEPLIQYGKSVRSPLFPNIISAHELAKTKEQHEILNFTQFPYSIAKSAAVGQNVPKEQIEILRKAFMGVCKDAEFIKEMKEKFQYTNCVEGSRVQEIILENEARYQKIKHLFGSE